MVSIAEGMTDLSVSGAGLGVGVERLGLAISSPMTIITKTQLLFCSTCISTNYHKKLLFGPLMALDGFRDGNISVLVGQKQKREICQHYKVLVVIPSFFIKAIIRSQFLLFTTNTCKTTDIPIIPSCALCFMLITKC